MLHSWMAEGLVWMLQNSPSTRTPVFFLKHDTALVCTPSPHSLEHCKHTARTFVSNHPFLYSYCCWSTERGGCYIATISGVQKGWLLYSYCCWSTERGGCYIATVVGVQKGWLLYSYCCWSTKGRSLYSYCCWSTEKGVVTIFQQQ